MTWGPQSHGGVSVPQRVAKGGAGLYVLPILWGLSLPAWVVFGIVAAVAPTDLCSADGPICTARKSAAVADQLHIYLTVALIVFGVTAVITVLIAVSHARHGVAVMHTRVGLIVLTALVSIPHLLVYLIAHGIASAVHGRGRARKQAAVVEPATVAERLRDAPDTAAAIEDYIQFRTGKPAGAVVGWTLDGSDAPVTAAPRGGVLVLGPPGSGKTSAVLIPTTLIAPGACVSSSIKSDVMLATAQARARRGRVWHFDPGGDEVTPAGVEHVRWSPLVSVRSWDDALQVGKTMAAPMLKDDTGQGSGAHFVGRATDWVQVLLYAAHLENRSITSVARWAVAAADEASQTEVVTILDTAAASGDEGAEIAASKLLGLISTPDKERGSIISTMVALLRVYDSVSARRIGENPNFDPKMFVRSTDTLYITARPDKQALYAPLLAALLEQIRFETYDRTKREQAGLEELHPHVTFVLDEANTTAPIPLPAIISEAGGQGLHIVVGIQALGPAIARWGDAAKSFLTLFPTKVIFRGVFDQDTVHALSSASGEYDRVMSSYSVSTSYVGRYLMPLESVNPSYQTQRQKVLTEGDITSIPAHRALVWDGPQWGILGIGMHWEAGVWLSVTDQARARALEAMPTSE